MFNYRYSYQVIKEGEIIEKDIEGLNIKDAKDKLKARDIDAKVYIKTHKIIAREGGEITAINLFRTAEQYLIGYQSISRNSPNKNESEDFSLWKVRYFLLGHSLEIGFKAFLVKKGMELELLRRTKIAAHDLNKCFELALKKGLGIFSYDERKRIFLLNEYYKDSVFEYEKMRFSKLPWLMDIENINIKLLNEVKRTLGLKNSYYTKNE